MQSTFLPELNSLKATSTETLAAAITSGMSLANERGHKHKEKQKTHSFL